MKWWPNEPSYGDVVRVKLGSIYHYGIYLSDDKVVQFGLPPQSVKGEEDLKVLTSSVDDFCLNHIIEVLELDREERKKAYSKVDTATRALNRLGEDGYNIIHNNCEHFVYECLLGYKYSEQEEKLINTWKQMPFINIYLIDIKNVANTTVQSKDRNKYLSKIKDEKIRNIKAYVWNMMIKCLNHSIPNLKIVIKYHKTYFTIKDCDVSITYKDDIAFIGISRNSIGLSSQNKEDFNLESINSNSFNKMLKNSKFKAHLTKQEENNILLKEIMNKYYLAISSLNLTNIKYYELDSGIIKMYKGD